ncbi:thiamine phosphate synthase [Acetobacteraceae bacterium]|nr:thiamine phosphate synthase [Acetobacteraceae bacterium]
MSHIQSLKGLHVLTDSLSSLSILEQAKQAAENGAAIIQLRNKTASGEQMTLWGSEILKIISPYPCKLIINDHVNVAVEIQAHGLHVGQKDGDINKIREKIGSKMILGLSITQEDQLQYVPAHCVDYLGVGPLRATNSKKDHDVPLDFEGVATIIKKTDIPAIVIGGITYEDIPHLKKTGATGIAVISAISQNKNPAQAIRLFSETWRNQT